MGDHSDLDHPGPGLGELAHLLACDECLPAAFRESPATVLDRFGVRPCDLPALSRLLDAELADRPVAEQRARKALVFLAFARAGASQRSGPVGSG